MNYVEVSFIGLNEVNRDHLMGWLTGWNHNGILEENEELKVYFSQEDFIEVDMEDLAQKAFCSFQYQIIPEQNWNSQWEHNFQPVILGSFCGIRADFHAPIEGVKYELIVTPKMSFGTGHHETTALMVRFMEKLDLAGKKVLDFGCGTGILSILAEKMGATSILALDNDEWSIRNAIENVAANSCTIIEVKNEAINQVSFQFDCIFANINRNVLLAYMKTFPLILSGSGRLLLSGFFTGEDEEVIVSAAEASGLRLMDREYEGKWAALLFKK